MFTSLNKKKYIYYYLKYIFYCIVTIYVLACVKIIFITFRVNSRKHKVIASLYIPELRMKGNYNLKGQLFMFPIEGDGIFHAKYGTSLCLLN